MSITTRALGSFKGKQVEEAVLTGDGVSVNIMNWGVVVRDWQVKASEGMRHVVLGFDSFEPYPEHSPHFGSLAGRIANRVANGRFTLAGKTYELELNNGDNQLHGGSEGLGHQVWSMDVDSDANAVRFIHDSPDGAMGYPGNVRFEAVYTLEGKMLILDLFGFPDRPTPISLVQHQYFNLGQTDTVLDHTLHMPFSVARTVLDDDHVAHGEIVPIAGTQFDFTTPKNLRDGKGEGIGFDLNYALATGRDASDPVAICTGEDKELTLKLWTDRPGLQLYNSVTTDIAPKGLGGKSYKPFCGVCFEDQMFPNAVNVPHFPDVICTPDEPYSHRCMIEIA